MCSSESGLGRHVLVRVRSGPPCARRSPAAAAEQGTAQGLRSGLLYKVARESRLDMSEMGIGSCQQRCGCSAGELWVAAPTEMTRIDDSDRELWVAAPTAANSAGDTVRPPPVRADPQGVRRPGAARVDKSDCGAQGSRCSRVRPAATSSLRRRLRMPGARPVAVLCSKAHGRATGARHTARTEGKRGTGGDTGTRAVRGRPGGEWVSICGANPR